MGLVLYNKPSANEVLLSGVQTASVTGAAKPGYAGTSGLIFQLVVTAASGTTPTLDVVIEDTIDGVNWFNIATFAQVTGAATQVQRYSGVKGPQVRARATIGGTTPSFTFSVTAFLQG